MKTKWKILLAVIAILLITFFSAAYIVPEGRQAVITQFGKPIGRPVTTTGLHLKKPFIQDVRYVDKRILTWDGYPNQIPTKDKKYIHVDTTARWQIDDALKFIQTVQNERGAKGRLDAILDAATRDTISNNNLVEAVRNTNSILENLEKRKKDERKKVEAGEKLVEEEITGEVDKIKTGRESLSQLIVDKADKELESFGISVIDVQLKRITYEKSVQQKVYERMISERQRVAEKIRSIGKGEKAKIEGRMSKKLQKIESRAYGRSQEIKGAGEAKAINIYAKTLSKDPGFYEFIRTMDAYKESLKANTHFILSSESQFLNYLKSQK